MADQTIPPRHYYVYALYRSDGTPFYVGMGSGQRWMVHERNAPRGHSWKDRIIMKMRANGIASIPKRKLAEGLSWREAGAIEMALISSIGRAPNGPLVNHTKGGDGVADPSEEARAKKAARNRLSWADPEVRRKRVDALKAVWTPAKRAEHRKEGERLQRAEIKIAQRAGYEAHYATFVPKPKAPASKKTKEERSAIVRETWTRPGARERRGAIQSIAKRKPNVVARSREIMLAPDIREKLNAGNARPEVRERRIAAQKAAFSTPEAKAKRSAVSKAMWAKKKGQYDDPSPREHASHAP